MPKPHFFDVHKLEWTPHPQFPEIGTKLLQSRADNPLASIMLAQVAVGGVIESHTHEGGTEIAYVLSGRGRLIVEGEEAIMEVGNGITIPPGMSHRMYNESEEPLVLFAIHSPPAR